MNPKTFSAFIGPSIVMMILFIALPLASVLKQSFYVTQPVYEILEVETCTPNFTGQVCVVDIKTIPKIGENGIVETKTKFVGFLNYQNVLEFPRVITAIANNSWQQFMTIDFWKALRFTLSFTLITLPLVLFLGLVIALCINNVAKSIRGPVIFISLLPMIITPVIGALAIRWLFIGDGILTAFLEWWLMRDIAMFAQAWTLELMMMFYRVWHVAPFAAIVFYAALQTVNQDTVESAIIDGASRWQKLRYVILPHLMPLIVFVTLIHLMDSYRVFEEVVGFSSQAHVISLQWLTYDFLMLDQSGNRSISRASASAMLTMIGIILLLIPVLRGVWIDYKGKRL
jgi:multiple sugar transport system permease protein